MQLKTAQGRRVMLNRWGLARREAFRRGCLGASRSTPAFRPVRRSLYETGERPGFQCRSERCCDTRHSRRTSVSAVTDAASCDAPHLRHKRSLIINASIYPLIATPPHLTQHNLITGSIYPSIQIPVVIRIGRSAVTIAKTITMQVWYECKQCYAKKLNLSLFAGKPWQKLNMRLYSYDSLDVALNSGTQMNDQLWRHT